MRFTSTLVCLAALVSPILALTADQQAALDAHNTPRKAKSLVSLTWDTKLEADAQAYANKLASTNGPLQHGSSGENLYWRSPAGSNSLKAASDAFLGEAKNYHNEVIPQGNFGAYGHYTQAMWKSTTKVGIAQAKDSKGGVYVVARYNPAGNVVGQRPY